MRAYLLYSSSAHFLLLAALFIVSRNSFGSKKEKAYYIDFIGPSSVVTMQKAAAPPMNMQAAMIIASFLCIFVSLFLPIWGGPEAAPAKEARPAKAAAAQEAPDPEDFSSGPLPKPSVLSGGAKLFEPEAAPAAGEGGTPLTTDSANFPYPWYITQVREALWNSWTERMPSAGSLRCTVRFAITRSGAVKSVNVEKSSGNRLFDNAAESAVQAAAPFQPLPDDFFEDRLTVHVEFKAGE